MLKVIKCREVEIFEEDVNNFISSHNCIDVSYDSVYSDVGIVFVAFITYEDVKITNANDYYNNSDNMTMEEILYDAG